jgi:GNAT superfamily N-acetyltransferase
MARIRPLRASDSTLELTLLIHRAYRRLANLGLRYSGTRQSEEATRRRVSKGECLVAEREGRLVGTVTLVRGVPVRGSLWLNLPGVVYFEQFAVEPELQGLGIGSALLREVERRASAGGAREVSLDTAERAEHLVRFYASRGYRTVERVRWPGKDYWSVVMSKGL